ncbi:hypothetical protein D9M71_382410 [compost metagenome]
MVPGLFQLQGRATGRFAWELEPGDTHGPHRRIAGGCKAHEDFPPALERQQQARFGVFLQLAGCTQGLAQGCLELATEGRKLLAIIGVQHLQPDTAECRKAGQVLEQNADPIGFRQLDERTACPLSRENQVGKTQFAHQPLGTFGIVADELGARCLRFGLGVAGNIQARRMFGDFRTDFTFEAGPAMHKQGIHSPLLGSRRHQRRQPDPARTESKSAHDKGSSEPVTRCHSPVNG